MRPTSVIMLPVILGIAGCAALKMPEQNAAELAALKPSARCEASLPFFGLYFYPGQILNEYQEADGQISMNNDGGWCMIRHVYTRSSNWAQPTLAMGVPPQHGSVVFGVLDGVMRIAYRPEPGYSGPDAFIVKLVQPVSDSIPVHVRVGS